MSNSYLADPETLSDEQLRSWLRNFRVEHPSLDTMQDYLWAGRISAEAKKRGVTLDDPEPEPEPSFDL